ncbi:MAG: hypothetical protein ACYS9C_00265 [Planctomycetota bacterium]
MKRFGVISSVSGPTGKPTSGFGCRRALRRTPSGGADMTGAISARTTAAVTNFRKLLCVSFMLFLKNSLSCSLIRVQPRHTNIYTARQWL